MGKYDAELIATAKAISTPGKGILAADESTNTIGTHLAKISLENNEANRLAYRNVLLDSELDISQYISGVILFEETLYQNAHSTGKPFPELLKAKGILTGIKVDKGVVVIPGTDGDTATQGLDDLHVRTAKYYAAGARFAKWRAVLKIGPKSPSEVAIQENAHGLARYAAICQENGLVPIVEPEILMDGAHDIETSASVGERVLAAVFKALADNHVLLEGILLKPNMVLTGYQNETKASLEQIAKYTIRTLKRTVPPAVPGITFLSGGQTETGATELLNAMHVADSNLPWYLTFSFGRALQSSTLKAWKGDPKNIENARKVFLHRAKMNSLATLGKYVGEDAAEGASDSLYVKGYVY